MVRAEGSLRCGAVVDLRDVSVDGAALAAAVRDEASPYDVCCPPAGAVHERVGHVRPSLGVRTRTALAAAARSRGREAPQDDERAALRDRLADLPVGPADSPNGPSASEDELAAQRERVAELRGRVQALEDADRDPGEARTALREAAGRLSELETRRVAAAETRERVRERRDRRERRLRLSDRLANVDRAARAHLVETVSEEYAEAVADRSPAADPFDADPVTAALAVLRVARVRAPVVLSVDRFESPAAAAEWLSAPVVVH